MKTIDDLISWLRSDAGIAAPEDGDANERSSDAALARYLNYSLCGLACRIVTATGGLTADGNLGWFLRTREVAVDALLEVDLPSDVAVPIALYTGRDASNMARKSPVYERNNRLTFSSGVDFLPAGDRVMIPNATAGTAMAMRYNSHLANTLFKGTATGGSTTNLTATALSYGMNLEEETDYYRGLKLRIVSGTGAGQTRKIQSYAFASGVATFTLASAWSTTPDSTSVFASICPVPEGPITELLVKMALARMPWVPEGAEKYNDLLAFLMKEFNALGSLMNHWYQG